jgi:hypothetical protein
MKIWITNKFSVILNVKNDINIKDDVIYLKSRLRDYEDELKYIKNENNILKEHNNN